MTTIIKKPPLDGLVIKIQHIEKDILQNNVSLLEAKEQLHNSELFKKVYELEKEQRENNKQLEELKETAKNVLIDNNIKSFESISWTVLKLKKTPWKLVITNNELIPTEYIINTPSINKKELKKDIQEWLIIDWVTIESDYIFNINYK